MVKKKFLVVAIIEHIKLLSNDFDLFILWPRDARVATCTSLKHSDNE